MQNTNKKTRISLLALGIVALMVMNVTPVSGGNSESVGDSLEADRSDSVVSTASPVDGNPSATDFDATEWVYAYYSEESLEIEVFNPLLMQSLGANPTGVRVDTSSEGIQGLPFDLSVGLTGLATDGDQIELFVVDNKEQNSEEEIIEIIEGYVNKPDSPTSAITMQLSRVLSHFDQELKYDYGDLITFYGAPAAAAAEYVIKIDGNYHFISIWIGDNLVSTAPTSASSSHFAKTGDTNGTSHNESITPPSVTDLPGVDYQQTAGSTTVVFEDNFNNGARDSSKWTSYSGASESSNCGSTSSPYALYFSGTSSRSATTQPIFIGSGYTLEFDVRRGTQSGGGVCDMPDNNTDDDFALEYTTNGGATWARLSTFYTENHASWTHKSFNLPSDAESSATQFRWRVLNHAADSQRDHWAVDDFKISTQISSRQPFSDNFNDGIHDTSKWASYDGVSESSNCGSTSSPYALYFSGTSGRKATTHPIDMSAGGTVKFSIRHGTGAGGGPCDQPEPGDNDNLVLEYSTNGGSTWYAIKYHYAGDYNSWATTTLTIPSGAETTQTQFRWRVQNFAPYTDRDHWAIDDVQFKETELESLDVFTDNFNNGYRDTEKWKSYVGASESSNCGYTSSPRALYFSGTNGRSATTNPIDVQPGGTVQFTLRHGTQTGGGFCDTPDANTDDDFALEYSTNGGSSWARMATYYAQEHGYWSTQNVLVPADAATPATQFRWRVLNHASDAQRDHWLIDDVNIDVGNSLNEDCYEGNGATNYEFKWQPGYVGKGEEYDLSDTRQNLGWGGWRYYYEFGNARCTEEKYRIVDATAFGFGFYGVNKLQHADEILRYGAAIEGDTCVDGHTCQESDTEYDGTQRHSMRLNNIRFFYKQPADPGVEHQEAVIDGRPSASCSKTFNNYEKAAITIASVKFPWLGLSTFAPDRYCTENWEEITHNGAPGLGVRTKSIESTNTEQQIAGHMRTDYFRATPGPLLVEFSASVEHRMVMSGCAGCDTATDRGAYEMVVKPAMEILR